MCERDAHSILLAYFRRTHIFWWNINMMMVTHKFICISHTHSSSPSPSLSSSEYWKWYFGLLFDRSNISLYFGLLLSICISLESEKIEIRTDRIFIFICIFMENNDFEEMAKKVESSHRRYIKYILGLCSSMRPYSIIEGKSRYSNKSYHITSWSSDRPTDSGLNRVKNVDASGQTVHMSSSLDIYKMRWKFNRAHDWLSE